MPGHQCAYCTDPAVVQWTRRPTDPELAAAIAVDEARRDAARAVAEQGSPPQFGPLPTAADVTIAVYACAAHAISPDLAARVHQAHCTGPASPNLPDCDCTPEALAEATPPAAARALPPGW